ncbi:MAG: alcohol dehydrogenase catalytic domain-containing protein [Pseudomonadota bacterium]|nr:alcohol dehydrogenase catalytic domain-containing protein [Pseudomonadota bacterium]
MRVAMYYRNDDVRIEERPIPDIGPGELLVKVMASGICGSDIMEWYRMKKAPLVLGHEIAGTVVAVGDGVDAWHPGDRVFVSHHIPCNTCRYCLSGCHTACETLHGGNYDPGGFAEYLRVPRLNVDRGTFLLPGNVSFAAGAMIEPLACVVRGQRLARLQPGQSALILGSGISGILHVMLARATGAGNIMATDISAYRRDQAARLGADAVADARDDIPAWVRQVNEGRLADLVIVCAGAPAAFVQSLQCVDRGGTILCFATTAPGIDLAVPINDFWRNEIKIMPSYGNSPQDAVTAIELIRLGRVPVERMITHRLPLTEAQRGFRLVADGGEGLKVILLPHGQG